MPIQYKQVRPVIAQWKDVAEAMNGHPYRLIKMAAISPGSLSRAKKVGYFGEATARRIFEATNQRLKLTQV